MPKKFTFEEVKEDSKQRGFIIHSEEYINIKGILTVECKRGHITDKTYDSIRMGKGCNDCKKEDRKLKYEDVKEYIEKEKWKLNSKEYIDMNSKLEMICPEGHFNLKSFHSFKILGRRCNNNECQYRNMRDKNIDEFIIKEKYTIINSDKHKNLILKCPKDHTVETNWGHFKRGNRCGICNYAGTTEIKVKEQLEEFLKVKFKKVRPEWLINITGYKMELDMYNKELQIGIEYQGIQHYEENLFFHRKSGSFQEQLEKDKLKRELCKENGVFLIEIPYYEKNINNYLCKVLYHYFN